jgi:hypothetical protein
METSSPSDAQETDFLGLPDLVKLIIDGGDLLITIGGGVD